MEAGRAQNTGITEIKSHPCSAADPRHIELSGRLIHARDLRRGPCCPELKRVLEMSNLILLVMNIIFFSLRMCLRFDLDFYVNTYYRLKNYTLSSFE